MEEMQYGIVVRADRARGLAIVGDIVRHRAGAATTIGEIEAHTTVRFSRESERDNAATLINAMMRSEPDSGIKGLGTFQGRDAGHHSARPGGADVLVALQALPVPTQVLIVQDWLAQLDVPPAVYVELNAQLGVRVLSCMVAAEVAKARRTERV